ncbi:hypothetical protein M3J09_002626 [Ascochyta lentis]
MTPGSLNGADLTRNTPIRAVTLRGTTRSQPLSICGKQTRAPSSTSFHR